MDRKRIIIAATATAFVFAVLASVLLLSLPEQSQSTTAAVQALPVAVESADATPAKPEEPAVAETPAVPETLDDSEPAQTAASAEPAPETIAALETTTVPKTTAALEPEPSSVSEPAATPEPAPELQPAAMAEIVPPGFDVVRVETTGETVLAGRAMAGSEVSVMDGDESLGEVVVDGRGQWAFVVDKPLTPGSHELSLEARLSDGRVVTSTDIVVVNVPKPQVATAPQASPEPAQPLTAAGTGTKISPEITVTEKPLAVLMPRSGQGPSQVLLQSASPREGLAEGALVLETIDYDETGAIIGGRAEPGARLIVYLDESALGETVAGPDGRWSLVLNRPLAIGLHRMRVDVVDAKGQVTARVETPFSRAALVASLPDETSVVVQPGNSLWRIARRVYGKGVRYTVIYEANLDQIREADLIYPGQIFKVPMTIPVAAPAAN